MGLKRTMSTKSQGFILAVGVMLRLADKTVTNGCHTVNSSFGMHVAPYLYKNDNLGITTEGTRPDCQLSTLGGIIASCSSSEREIVALDRMSKVCLGLETRSFGGAGEQPEVVETLSGLRFDWYAQKRSCVVTRAGFSEITGYWSHASKIMVYLK